MKKLFLFGAILLGGCTVGPKYNSPEPPVPSEWKSETADEDVKQVGDWWDLFEDDVLADLEEKVIQNNPDILAAMERVIEARTIAGVKRSDLFPHIDFRPGYDNFSFLADLPTGGLPGIKPTVRLRERFYEFPLTMRYEIDLWGKFRGQHKAALLNADARSAALRGVQLTLTSDLASNYFNMRELDGQILLMEEIVNLRKDFSELIRIRFRAGLNSALDVSLADQRLSDNQAELEELILQRSHFENAIATLIGRAAPSFTLETNPLKGVPPEVPAGIPSSILTQRPDIAQIEYEMESIHTEIGVAYSSFLPALNLSGALGFLSTELKDFLKWKSRLWHIGVHIAQTIFDGLRRKSELDGVYARFREAQNDYLSTVLMAFQETEDALKSVQTRRAQEEKRKISLAAATKSAHITQARFDAGIVNLLNVIDFREKELHAKQRHLSTLGKRYQSSLELIKALGGGWTDEELSDEACIIEKP